MRRGSGGVRNGTPPRCGVSVWDTRWGGGPPDALGVETRCGCPSAGDMSRVVDQRGLVSGKPGWPCNDGVMFPTIASSPDQLPGKHAHSRQQRGRRRLGLFVVGVVAAALVGLGTAGCGGGSDAPVAEYRVRPVRTVHLVVPLGLAGGDAKDMRAAVEMALADGGDAISGVRIRLRTNNTSGPTGAESAARAVDAAETAAIDPYSLAVIGSITSNGMRQMAPILNRAGFM